MVALATQAMVAAAAAQALSLVLVEMAVARTPTLWAAAAAWPVVTDLAVLLRLAVDTALVGVLLNQRR